MAKEILHFIATRIKNGKLKITFFDNKGNKVPKKLVDKVDNGRVVKFVKKELC